MRDFTIVADAAESVHDLAGVLLERVVHRGLRARTAAVVVHSEASTDIHVLDRGAEANELGVNVPQLSNRVLEAVNVVDLASWVAVHELQRVQHVVRRQYLHHVEDLAHEQPELGLLSGRALPAPRPLTGQLHPHSDGRADVVISGVLQNEMQFPEILDDRDDLPAELRRQDGRLDVAVILESVAHDESFGSSPGEGHHRQKLGLGADLEAEVVLGAVAKHLLDHRALLVHLDRVCRHVAPAIIVFGDSVGESSSQGHESVCQDIRKPDEERRGQVALAQSFHDLQKVDFLLGGPIRTDEKAPVGRHHEVPLPPVIDPVQVSAVCGGPRFGRALWFHD